MHNVILSIDCREQNKNCPKFSQNALQKQFVTEYKMLPAAASLPEHFYSSKNACC